jgi:hypothetical protein
VPDQPRLISKGWVSYDQTGTAAVLDSENVASVSDDGVGIWTVNWATDFTDTSYGVTTGVNDEDETRNFRVIDSAVGAAHLGASILLQTTRIQNAGTAVDHSFLAAVAHGDLVAAPTVDHSRLAAKAWVHYDNTGTATVDDSENVASVSDDATGQFTVNWETDFAANDYAVVTGTCDEAVSGHNYLCMDFDVGDGAAHLAASCAFDVRTVRNDALTDISEISVAAYGDLVSAPTVDHPRLIPKAWSSYDQTGTPAVLDSENVASVTDNATGDFTPVWDTDFANTDYTVVVGCTSPLATRPWMIGELGAGTNHLVGSCNMSTWVTNNNKDLIDADFSMVAAYGDQ